MDQKLSELLNPVDGAAAGGQVRHSLRVVRDQTGVIELETGGQTVRYSLKPLVELYAPDSAGATVDPMNPRYEPLFLAIEEVIQFTYRYDRGLTDGAVRLALTELTMNPSAETRDPLAREIQERLRLLLSLNDYSRTDVKGAVRKILKSVERHTKAEGPRGYLEFVRRAMRM
jgi:hypothetical protein